MATSMSANARTFSLQSPADLYRKLHVEALALRNSPSAGFARDLSGRQDLTVATHQNIISGPDLALLLDHMWRRARRAHAARRRRAGLTP